MSETSKWMGGLIGSVGVVLFGALLLVGCGGGSGTTDVTQQYGHYHLAGWIQQHPGKAQAGLAACTKCHELYVLNVGSGVPNCQTSGCHHQATPGFADPAIHGGRAKMAADPITGGSLVACQMCHGKDFAGGASANACASCHGVKAPHPPKPWRLTSTSTYTHATTDPSNGPVCAQCHYFGSPNNPAGHPAAAPPPGTEPGCYNATECHGANTASHAVPFLSGLTDSRGNGHMTASATVFASDCATCHAYSGASPTAAAPLCSQCHQLADPTVAGTNAGTCLSCHVGGAGLPGGPGGSSFPSLSGAHAKHMALATDLTCDTCHLGSGSGSTTHYTNANARTGIPAGPAPVVIDPIFTPKTGGAPAFTGASLTCNAVSCHGAQTTPGWQNGSLDSSTQCAACHAISSTAGLATQFNDAFGRHSKGAHNALVPANSITCTTCHNMSNGSPGALAHFNYLNTQSVDGVSSGTPADQLPSGTIVFDGAIVTGAGTYTVTSLTQGNGSCALTCHSHVHDPVVDTWTASGAPHPVPFLASQKDTQGNGHLNATQATFTADCASCHALTGPSPLVEAPMCSVCHTLADPTVPATGAGTCLSCHVGPAGLAAGPTGGAFPNIAGAHAKHMGLLTPLSCDTCHSGSGTGTTTHYNNANARVTVPTGPATVTIDATYNAQSGGTASFNPGALTCSSSSCHGGQNTPNWRTGTITSSTQCSLCHAINGGTTTSQYNDAIGRHAWGTHASAGTLDCTLCHDMSSANSNPGAVDHFKYLNTSAVSGAATGSPADQLPSGTLKFKLGNGTYPITGAASYTIDATHHEGDGGCALSCHGQTHEPVVYHWNADKGAGVAHPVPFLSTDKSTGGNHHQSVTLAQFNAECATCHDETGATSKSGPVCTVCHTLGSPLSVGKGVGTCLSCHVGSSFTSAGPGGSAWPNLKGSHPKHLSLTTFTRPSPALPAALTASAFPQCEACHVGSVPEDAPQTHYSNASKRVAVPVSSGPASVTIHATFNAQSGTAGTSPSNSAFTCSNISCHGGQATPGWQSGALTVNATTYCNACHVVDAAQYNAPTGRHGNPGEHKQTCDYCHDMTQANAGSQNHFKYLDTPTVSGVSGNPADQYPSDTIAFGANVTGNPTYTVTSSTQGKGGCALTCHSEGHSASDKKWK